MDVYVRWVVWVSGWQGIGSLSCSVMEGMFGVRLS